MSKHRTVQARALPLPETPVYKTYAEKKVPANVRSKISKAQIRKPASLAQANAQLIAALKKIPKINGDVSDSESSAVGTDSIATDTNSVFSDETSSIINNDFDHNLTLSFKSFSEDEAVELHQILQTGHISEEVPLSHHSSVSQDDHSDFFDDLPPGLSKSMGLSYNDDDDDLSEGSFSQSSAASEETAARIVQKELQALCHKGHANRQALRNDFYLREKSAKRIKGISGAQSGNVSADEVSDVTTFSCGSTSLDRDGLLLLEQCERNDGLQESRYGVLKKEHAKLKVELEQLKQSLKLSKADTAILVSAKQQLQLDWQETCETNRCLREQLEKCATRAAESERDLITLKRTVEREQDKHNREMESVKEILQNWKERYLRSDESFEKSRLENAELKDKLDALAKDCASKDAQNENLQKEAKELISRNTKLSALIEQSGEDQAGSQEYIKTIRSERDEYAKRLHEKIQEALTHQIAIQGWEERHGRMSETNAKLASEKEELVKIVEDNEAQIKSLQVQLSLKSNEKAAFDHAVSRLHDDLFKVETGFHKIRKEMVQKSGVAEKELTMNVQLKRRVAILEKELERLGSEAELHAQRIGDKNNQIAQLLSQLHSESREKSVLAANVNQLKTHIAANEKSWVEAIEKEKRLVSHLKEKTASLRASDTLCAQLSLLLEEEKAKTTTHQEEIEAKLSSKQDQVVQLQNEMSQLKYEVDKKDELIRSHDIALERLKLEIKKRDHRKEMSLQMRESHETGVEVRASGEDAAHAGEQMELVAELQSARRELAEEVNLLLAEREGFETRQSEMRETLGVQLRDERKEKEAARQEKLNVELKLNKKLVDLGNRVDEKEKEANDLRNELSDLSRKCDEMVQTKEELDKLLRSNQQDSEKLLASNATLKEELAFVKREMNLNALRLMEDMKQQSAQTNCNDPTVAQLQQVTEERNRLREAVEQQQRYMLALHAHYQQWADGATAKIKQAQAVLTHQPKTSVTCQTEMLERHLADGSSQTDHDLESCGKDRFAGGDPGAMSAIPSSKEIASQCNPRFSAVDSVNQAVDDCTQTEHDLEVVGFFPTRAKRIVTRTDACSQTVTAGFELGLREIGTQTDFRPAGVTRVAVQTDDDCRSSLKSVAAAPSATDSFTQTSRDCETVDKLADLSPRLLETVFVQTDSTPVVSHGVQTSHDSEPCLGPTGEIFDDSEASGGTDSVGLVGRRGPDRPCASPQMVDQHTQTGHDDKLATRWGAGFVDGVYPSDTTDASGAPAHGTCSPKKFENFAFPSVAVATADSADSATCAKPDPPQQRSTCPACGKLKHVAVQTALQSSSTQTSHDLEPAHNDSGRFERFFGGLATDEAGVQTTDGRNIRMPRQDTENAWTQTDHDLYPVCDLSTSRQFVLFSDAFSQTNLDAQPSTVVMPTALTTRTDLVASGTQTDHDLDPVVGGGVVDVVGGGVTDVAPADLVTVETQTYPGEEIAFVESERNGKLRNCLPRVAAATQTKHLLRLYSASANDISVQTDHDWEPASWTDACQLVEKPTVLNTETQTEALVSLASKHFCADGHTQTEHDLEPVGSGCNRNNQDDVSDRQESTGSHGNLVNDICHLAEDDGYHSFATRAVVSSQTQSSFSRTGLSDDTTQTDIPANSTSTQTDHDEESLVANRFVLERSPPFPRSPSSDGNARDGSTQTDHDDELLPMPNPVDVAMMLSSADASKLKAYKATVKVLRSKLKVAEERLSCQAGQLAALQKEVAAYQELAKTKCSSRREDTVGDSEKSNGRLREEIEALKEAAGIKELELTTLKVEMDKLKRGSDEALSKHKRKAIADRRLSERRLKESNEKVKALVDANEALRNAVEKMQVKLATSQKQLETAKRDKLRYQDRARKLQANLRSLAWLAHPPPGEEQAPPTDATTGANNNPSSANGSGAESHAAVGEIEDSLKALRSEISSLEKQLTDHNQLVHQSKSTWQQLRRRESSDSNGLARGDSWTASVDGNDDSSLGEIV